MICLINLYIQNRANSLIDKMMIIDEIWNHESYLRNIDLIDRVACLYYNGISSIRATISFQFLIKSQPDLPQIHQKHRRLVIHWLCCTSHRHPLQAINPHLRHITILPSQKTQTHQSILSLHLLRQSLILINRQSIRPQRCCQSGDLF